MKIVKKIGKALKSLFSEEWMKGFSTGILIGFNTMAQGY